MGSKTKIIVLHMKEIIYTAVFAALGILVLCLLFFMFASGDGGKTMRKKQYTPGIYTSQVTLNQTHLEVEVSVDESSIQSIRISNLDETVMAMYPLLQPTIEDLASQICEKQSLEDIRLSEENPYTAQVLVNAVEEALNKAKYPAQ